MEKKGPENVFFFFLFKPPVNAGESDSIDKNPNDHLIYLPWYSMVSIIVN